MLITQKKIVALILIVCLIFCLSDPAFAENNRPWHLEPFSECQNEGKDDQTILHPTQPDVKPTAAPEDREEETEKVYSSDSLYPADISNIDVEKAFIYNTLSLIALEKYNNTNIKRTGVSDADDIREKSPDAISVAFVLDCADEAFLLELGRFPETSDGELMLQWFLEHGAEDYRKKDIITSNASALAEPDDLLFFKSANSVCVAIVAEADSTGITYLESTSIGNVSMETVSYTDLPSNVHLIKWKEENDFLLSYICYLCQDIGFTPAAAVGVLANMWYESEFNPHALGDNGTSYGLCQWHLGRWGRLIQVCTEAELDWSTADGQLFYLKQELQEYEMLKELMNRLPNNPTGAKLAAYWFSIRYERPSGGEDAAITRGFYAMLNLYPSLIYSDDDDIQR